MTETTVALDLTPKDLEDLARLYDDAKPCAMPECERPVTHRMIMPCCGDHWLFCAPHTDFNKEQIAKYLRERNWIITCSGCGKRPDLERITWLPA